MTVSHAVLAHSKIFSAASKITFESIGVKIQQSVMPNNTEGLRK
jgi:hypothetical protein